MWKIERMKKIIQWLKTSNRWKHLVGGMIIGLGADGFYCAAYAGGGIAAALEFKDKCWGGSWDWIDFAMTFSGAIAGQLIHFAIWRLFRM